MKKGIYITLLTVIISQGCFSKSINPVTEMSDNVTIEQLFTDFGKEKHTVHVKLGSFTMSLIRIFTNTNGVHYVDVYSFDECKREVKEKFNATIRNLKDTSYETLLSISENGERTKVFIKMKDDFVREIVVVTGGNDPAMIKIKGKIKPDDIQNVINKNKK
jgi:type 1 fimbria pilin